MKVRDSCGGLVRFRPGDSTATCPECGLVASVEFWLLHGLREGGKPKPRGEWIVVARLASMGSASFQDLVEEGVVTLSQARAAKNALLLAGFIEPHSAQRGASGRMRTVYRIAPQSVPS